MARNSELCTYNHYENEANKNDDKAQTQDVKQLNDGKFKAFDQHEDEAQEEDGEALTQDVKELDAKQNSESCF